MATAHMRHPALGDEGVNTEETGVNTSGIGEDTAGEGTLETNFQGSITDNSPKVPPAEVSILDKRYIHNVKHKIRLIRWIIMFFRLIRHVLALWRDYNSEEAKLERLKIKRIKADLRDGAKRLQSAAMGLGFKAIEKMGKYARNVTIRFDVMAWEEPNGDRLFYHVAAPLPDGVWGADLVKREVLNEFQRSMQHPMSGYDSPHTGTLLIVERAGQSGLPRYVALKAMLDEMPTSAPPLAFPAGVAYNGRSIFLDLAEGPHTLIVGGSRKGKSNMQNAIITTWALRNNPSVVQLILFDIKRGVEFGRYKGLKLLMSEEELGGSPIIEVVEDVLPRLKAMRTIMERRLDLLKDNHVTNIGEYNLRHRGKSRMPFIVLFFDEWAVARLDPGCGKEIEMLVTVLANQGAAAGFHIVIGTQNPKASILDSLLTINFQMRLCFSLTQYASMAVLGNWDAVNLEVPGRMVAQVHDNKFMLQAPRISNSTIEAVIKASKSGEAIQEMARLDPDEICIYALDKLGGELTFDLLFSHYRESGITQAGLKAILKSMDNDVFILRETPYRVIPGAGIKPRHLERVPD